MIRRRFDSVDYLIVAIAGLLLVAGIAVGWWLFLPAPVVETPAPTETQGDGSVLAGRAPNATAKPAHQIPKRAKVERVGQVTVQGQTPPEVAACTSTPCPPVTIDTSLVRLPDGSKRVVVSSPDGKVLDAVDIPVETAAPPPEPPQWAVGLSLDPIKQTPGIWVERDIWRVRVGAEVNQTRLKVGGPTAAELRVRVGWAF